MVNIDVLLCIKTAIKALLHIAVKPTVALLFATVAVLSACNYDTRDSGRSGTYQDDNLENPLLEDFIQYKEALATSNRIIDLMQEGNAKAISENYVLEELQPLLTEKDIAAVIANAKHKYGRIVSYKPMQWGFEPRVENGKRDKSEFNRVVAEKYGSKKAASNIPVLFSVKIVQHEHALVEYWFQFPADGEYKKLLGIFYKEKKGTRNIGQF